MIKSFLSD